MPDVWGLVRSAVCEQLPSGARSQAHARAAQLLAGEGVEPEQVAVQLLACEPAGDADAVRALRAAAAPALARGAPDTAATRRAGMSRAIGIALRVCGLLTGGKAGIELLEQSVAVLEPTPVRLELAHSLTELGAALRRGGARTAAREPLRRALDLAARCGATPLAARAREEALAAGARPRRPWTSGVHSLTPSELRVARLAAQAMGTVTSLKRCSSPPKPSATTSPAPTENSTSTPAINSPQP